MDSENKAEKVVGHIIGMVIAVVLFVALVLAMVIASAAIGYAIGLVISSIPFVAEWLTIGIGVSKAQIPALTAWVFMAGYLFRGPLSKGVNKEDE